MIELRSAIERVESKNVARLTEKNINRLEIPLKAIQKPLGKPERTKILFLRLDSFPNN